MKNLALLIFISILSFSCSKSDDGDVNTDADFIVYPNSSLAIIENNNSSNIMVESGDNLVFKYTYSTEGDPDIIDDEYTEVVYFEVEANAADFSLNSADFESAKAYIGKFCFCGRTGYFPVTSGEITAKKTGNLQWQVSLDIEAALEPVNNAPEMSFNIEASGRFRPEN